MTGEQMCEVIAAHWKREYGITVDPESIWNYSPTGELWYVYTWYEQATQAEQLANKMQSPDPES